MRQIHLVLQNHEKDGYLMSYYSPPFSPPPSLYSNGFHKRPTTTTSTTNPPSSGSKISPAVLFIIVILAVLFFISGLLHLLVRFLTKHPPPPSSSSDNRYPDFSNSDALQRQLQQLFHLHDSGLDQAFIDALPVFHYREIVGPKEPFDCAVCLCEFSDKDKLRLLPACSHAFHISCIDTWLLSNSTCPLCRGALFSPPGYSIENPVFDLDEFRDDDIGVAAREKSVQIEEAVVVDKGVLPVRLGKFRRVIDPEGVLASVGETSSSKLDARRCFSMGSYEYVLASSALRVSALSKRPSEKGQESANDYGGEDLEGKKISSVSKGESYSVSKIWQWSKKGNLSSSLDSNPNSSGMPSSLNVDLPWMGKK